MYRVVVSNQCACFKNSNMEGSLECEKILLEIRHYLKNSFNKQNKFLPRSTKTNITIKTYLPMVHKSYMLLILINC